MQTLELSVLGFGVFYLLINIALTIDATSPGFNAVPRRSG